MKRILSIILLLPLLAGCAQSVEKQLDNVRKDFSSGEFKNQKVSDRNLDPLLAGNALFQQDKFAESDRAFENINKRMADAQRTSIAGEVGRALTNPMSGPYRPYFMDDLFVSYYQIWSALGENRIADARVLINQSYAKQQRLSGEYAKMIRSRERDDSGLAASLRAENSEWKVFSDIMNPALTYLAGIYFLNFARSASDFETARTYLTRASGMAPNAGFIRDDIALARARKGPEGIAWIFIESGFAPRLTEKRIDWPVFTQNGVRVMSIAVSDAVVNPAPARIDGAQLIADVDAMFMTEHVEYKINEALRALASTISKLALQTVAENQLGPWGSLGAAIYSIATTAAEVRTWATLPKRIYAMRVEKKNEGLIVLKSGGRVISEIKIPKVGNHLIYIRYFGDKAEPKIIELKG